MDNLTLVVRRSAAQHSTDALELLMDNLTLVVRPAASQHSTDTPGAADRHCPEDQHRATSLPRKINIGTS